MGTVAFRSVAVRDQNGGGVVSAGAFGIERKGGGRMRKRCAYGARLWLRRLPAACALVGLVAVGFSAVALTARHMQEKRGEGAVASPAGPSLAFADAAPHSGRFTSTVAYTSLDAPGTVSSQVTWDDSWFVSDDTVYNHELARASSVLAALAYSESGYYQAQNEQPPYMEQALAQLGFSDVSTASYRYRSEVVDEVLNLFTDDSDAVAYAIARKHLQPEGGDGTARDLIMVSIRGSYGSEWLSNLNLLPVDSADGSAVAGKSAGQTGGELAGSPALVQAQENLSSLTQPLTNVVQGWLSFVDGLTGASSTDGGQVGEDAASGIDGTDDPSGYFRASADICRELNGWIADSRAAGSEVSVLVVGHSRGGAIANLVASELDDQRQPGAEVKDGEASFSEVSGVFAYTFASPATTVRPDAHSARYGNIFNIVNPSDIMPYLPLRAWGYERYGVNLYLPSQADAGFDGAWERMRACYRASVGVQSAYDPADEQAIAAALAEVSARVSSAHELMTPTGAAAALAAVAAHIDPVRILYGHYPTTYIAWLDAVDGGALVRE